MDNLDVVTDYLRVVFSASPDAEVLKASVAEQTGIPAASLHPILQMMCGGPGSNYEHMPRARELRGILDRHSRAHGGRTYFTLSPSGRTLLFASAGQPRHTVALVSVGAIGAVLTQMTTRTFSSVDFVDAFARHQPEEWQVIVDNLGRGGAGSGHPYSAASHLARSLGRYARQWAPATGHPEVRFDGWIPASESRGAGRVARWTSGDDADEVLSDLQQIAVDLQTASPLTTFATTTDHFRQRECPPSAAELTTFAVDLPTSGARGLRTVQALGDLDRRAGLS